MSKEKRDIKDVDVALEKTANKDKWQNTDMADGASLAMGSPEYRERVMDLQGIDEFEQEEVKKAMKGIRQNDDPKTYSEWHEEYFKTNESHPEVLNQTREEIDALGKEHTERVVSNQIIKASAKKGTMMRGRREAKKTETLEDDKRIERRLPKMLDDIVYNEGKTKKDIEPGYDIIDSLL